MSDFSSFRSWLRKFDLDLKSACYLLVFASTAIWGLSMRYSALTTHMQEIDHYQVEMREALRDQNQKWMETLKEQNSTLVEQLKQMNSQSVIEEKTLDERLTSMEKWKNEEEDKVTGIGMSVARIGEQVSATREDITDLKSFLQTILIEKRSLQK